MSTELASTHGWLGLGLSCREEGDLPILVPQPLSGQGGLRCSPLLLPTRPFMPNLVPPKIPDGERVVR